jgi:serine/threonine protein kinase
MPLSPGYRLGVFSIVGPIGAGGMGEVYRARDTKLNRDVAIKVIPEAFAADADRLARFEREAAVVATYGPRGSLCTRHQLPRRSARESEVGSGLRAQGKG